MSDETSEIERLRAMVARYDACGCGNAYAHAGTIEDYRVMVAAIDAARERIAELEAVIVAKCSGDDCPRCTAVYEIGGHHLRRSLVALMGRWRARQRDADRGVGNYLTARWDALADEIDAIIDAHDRGKS